MVSDAESIAWQFDKSGRLSDSTSVSETNSAVMPYRAELANSRKIGVSRYTVLTRTFERFVAERTIPGRMLRSWINWKKKSISVA